jgi:hypothetical protein
MFADDTQLSNKDERSVETSFDIHLEYEKASFTSMEFIQFNRICLISYCNFEV